MDQKQYNLTLFITGVSNENGLTIISTDRAGTRERKAGNAGAPDSADPSVMKIYLSSIETHVKNSIFFAFFLHSFCIPKCGVPFFVTKIS